MPSPTPLVPSPYRYHAIRRTRIWVPWVKRILIALRLAQLVSRWRGRAEWSHYTGGWNAPPSASELIERRLNLGCGQANYEGYINLDIVSWPHLQVQALGERLPFQSESFDEVLCTDVIEHLDAEGGLSLVQEVSRVLRRRGHVILVTPDLDSIMRIYRGRFGTHDQVIQHLLGNARDHRYLYTVPLLKGYLETAGLIVQRSIRHWGPIWAHTVILADKA
jgi:predicted SAM-dependent methyltransferase